MAAPLLALAVIGSATKAYGTYLEAKAKSRQLREEAEVSLIQSEEVLSRSITNAQATAREGRRFAGEQLAQMASSGVSVDSNASLSLMEDTASTIADEIIKIRSEAAFEAKMLRREAASAFRAARDTERAGKLAILGGAASSAGSIGMGAK